MKKTFILAIATVIALASVSINASAKSAETKSEATLSDMTMNEFVYLYEQSLLRSGYTVTNITSTQIEAVKTRPSRRDVADAFSSSDKKIKTKAITATFSKNENGYGVIVEQRTIKQTLDEWKDMVKNAISRPERPMRPMRPNRDRS